MTIKTVRNIVLAAAICVFQPLWANGEELLNSWDFNETSDGWQIYRGEAISHVPDDGHLTPNGALEVLGHEDGQSGIQSECIDVSHLGDPIRLRYEWSMINTGPGSDQSYGRIWIFYYPVPGCQGPSASTASDSLPASTWKDTSESLVPPRLTQSVRIILYRKDTPDGGGARFDDIAIYSEGDVRQFWAIGVGEIADNTIMVDEMVYTRGGAFGAALDPSAIEREPMGSLEFAFNGCDSGDMSFLKTFYSGGIEDIAYPVIRLAANQAVVNCTEQGFGNLAVDDNGWMAGYWWGGPERDGEGFAIDVLEDGVTAVVTWYTYQADSQ